MHASKDHGTVSDNQSNQEATKDNQKISHKSLDGKKTPGKTTGLTTPQE
jgi:hypothetical protein